MPLKHQPLCKMPPDTIALGAKHLAADDPYKLIGDILYDHYHNEVFAHLYHGEGKFYLSPVLLAFIIVFQALETAPTGKWLVRSS